MNDNVTQFPKPLTADDILDKAKGQLKTVVVLGWTHDGAELLASSTDNPGDILWLLESGKQILFEMD